MRDKEACVRCQSEQSRLSMKENVYSAIKAFIEDNGYSPTIQEIGKMVGYKTHKSVNNYLAELMRDGRIKINLDKVRGIELV